MKAATLGPAIFFSLDEVSHYAAMITRINQDGTVDLTTFLPSSSNTHLTRIKFDPRANQDTAKPGTCYPCSQETR